MYRILLADDEGIMLESLKSIIKSNFGEECEIECAKSGRAVVELAESFRPDITFMDIQMPGLNGIQAMKEIRKFNQSLLFIVITAYDKFNYAKEAINLGVVDYLTKPVNKRVVLDVLMKAMRQVDSTRQKRRDDLRIREKLETVVPIIENGFIYNALFFEKMGKTTANYRELLDIEEEYGCILLVEFGDREDDGRLTNAVGANVRAASFYQEFREIAGGFFRCIAGPIMGNRIVLLIPWPTPSITYEERVQLLEKTRSMIYKMEDQISIGFRAGIGRIKPLDEIRESYDEAGKALREEDSHIIHIKDVPAKGEYDGEYPAVLEKQFFYRIQKGDAQGAKESANAFFDWMLENYGEYPEDIKIKVLEFVLRMEKIAFDDGAVQYGFQYRKNYLKKLQAMNEYEQLRTWLLERTWEICRSIATAKSEESESVVSRAKHYIEENFQKDISLDDVSRLVDISPYYFSKLFKQEAGENFIEYLTSTRMKNAKLLLQQEKYSIKEVCLMSGYSDPNYFSRIFKKYEGVTPSEYRERLG